MSDLRMIDVTMKDIKTAMHRVDTGNYDNCGVLAPFKIMQDNLIVNLIVTFRDYPNPEKEREIDTAYALHCEDCAENDIEPWGETLATQYLRDAYNATMDYCLEMGII